MMNRVACAERAILKRYNRRLFTAQTSLSNPTQLTVVQLQKLLKENGLKVSGKKQDLITRLETHLNQQDVSSNPYDSKSLQELKEDCKNRKLTVSGSESDLRIRLQVDDEVRENALDTHSIRPDIRQCQEMKSPERLRFEQDTKHLLEVANLPAEGGTVSVSAAKFAHLSDGTAICANGDTSLMVTACCKRAPNTDFDDGVHLMVDYREKGWSKGFIPGGMNRWEGTPTVEEVLAMRVIDRSLRPLFPKFFPHQVQVISTLLSHDSYHESICLAINGASAALCMSGIPFAGPVGAVRIAYLKGRFVVNPKSYELEQSSFDLLYVASKDKAVMVEFGGTPVSEEKMIEGMRLAQQAVIPLVEAQLRLKEKHGKPEIPLPPMERDEAIFESVSEQARPQFESNFSNPAMSKSERYSDLDRIRQEIRDYMEHVNPGCSMLDVDSALYDCEWSCFREFVLNNDVRVDGRDFTTIRPLDSYVDVLPVSHGSSFFSRGDTQTVCSVTLGPHHLTQQRCLTEANHAFKQHRLYVQYEMPPFATNEVSAKKVGGRGRREIGHSDLACKSLERVMPSFEHFPQSIRLVSNITASNGSSSMATVCGGAMALMDAGVPIEPTVGISVGLLSADTECKDYRLLTDIMGIEDHLGDMDFKIASTKDGITGLQLDMKLKGIPLPILEEALYQAKECRPVLMDVITKDLKQSRPHIRHNAPLVEILKMPTKKLSSIIGTGGHIIRGIQQESGAELDTDLEKNTLEICAKDLRSLEHAKRLVNNIVGLRHDTGDLLMVTVQAIIAGKGAVVMTDDEKEHLIPESHFFLHGDKKNVVAVGQSIQVMVLDRIGVGGLELSRKAAILAKSDDPTDRANYLLLLRQSAKERQQGIIQNGRMNMQRRSPPGLPMGSQQSSFSRRDEPPAAKPWPWATQTPAEPSATEEAVAVDQILQRLRSISDELESDSSPAGGRALPVDDSKQQSETKASETSLDDTMSELLQKLNF